MESQTMHIEQAAKLLGVSRATAYRAARINAIPVIRLGRRILVCRPALERILRGGKTEEVQTT